MTTTTVGAQVCRLWRQPNTARAVTSLDPRSAGFAAQQFVGALVNRPHAIAFVETQPFGRPDKDWTLWRVETLAPGAYLSRKVTVEEAEIELRGHGIEVPQ